jgi:hypothetical protein
MCSQTQGRRALPGPGPFYGKGDARQKRGPHRPRSSSSLSDRRSGGAEMRFCGWRTGECHAEAMRCKCTDGPTAFPDQRATRPRNILRTQSNPTCRSRTTPPQSQICNPKGPTGQARDAQSGQGEHQHGAPLAGLRPLRLHDRPHIHAAHRSACGANWRALHRAASRLAGAASATDPPGTNPWAYWLAACSRVPLGPGGRIARRGEAHNGPSSPLGEALPRSRWMVASFHVPTQYMGRGR